MQTWRGYPNTAESSCKCQAIWNNLQDSEELCRFALSLSPNRWGVGPASSHRCFWAHIPIFSFNSYKFLGLAISDSAQSRSNFWPLQHPDAAFTRHWSLLRRNKLEAFRSCGHRQGFFRWNSLWVPPGAEHDQWNISEIDLIWYLGKFPLLTGHLYHMPAKHNGWPALSETHCGWHQPAQGLRKEEQGMPDSRMLQIGSGHCHSKDIFRTFCHMLSHRDVQ